MTNGNFSFVRSVPASVRGQFGPLQVFQTESEIRYMEDGMSNVKKSVDSRKRDKGKHLHGTEKCGGKAADES